MDLRAARPADLAAINAIYNHYVAHSACTYALVPMEEAERRAWFDAHGPQHPVLVAVEDAAVVGWGALSLYNPRGGYARTVEDSLYVGDRARGRGIGTALLGELLRQARALDHHAVLAGVDADEQPSLALHKRLGFHEVGRLREVGHKLGRFRDVILLELLL
jgi:phosphinothricin acetyltransferase